MDSIWIYLLKIQKANTNRRSIDEHEYVFVMFAAAI